MWIFCAGYSVSILETFHNSLRMREVYCFSNESPYLRVTRPLGSQKYNKIQRNTFQCIMYMILQRYLFACTHGSVLYTIHTSSPLIYSHAHNFTKYQGRIPENVTTNLIPEEERKNYREFCIDHLKSYFISRRSDYWGKFVVNTGPCLFKNP